MRMEVEGGVRAEMASQVSSVADSTSGVTRLAGSMVNKASEAKNSVGGTSDLVNSVVNPVSGMLVAAHELKEPLAIMRQLAFNLPEMPPEGEVMRQEMIKISERAMRQVNDLTRLNRLEAGLFSMEPVAVRAVCDEVTSEVMKLFAEQRRGLTIEYCNHERLVTANREMLKSVIYNFLTNAMRYSDVGTKTKLSVKDASGLVKICVRDFGPILPLDVWREMRRGFVKQPMSIAMRPGSSGLGLYIASKFSHLMQAKVGAVRHRDGTSFYVEIPVSRQMSLF